MKLLRVGAPGEERPAVRTEDGRLLDLSPVTSDIDGAFLASDGVDRARAAVAAGSLPELDPDGLRIGAPLARPGKIVCIGLNYRDHAAETGAAIPERAGGVHEGPRHGGRPGRRGAGPARRVKTDWEVELGVVIGRRARYLDGRRGRAGRASPATRSATTSPSASSSWSAAASGTRARPARRSTRSARGW